MLKDIKDIQISILNKMLLLIDEKNQYETEEDAICIQIEVLKKVIKNKSLFLGSIIHKKSIDELNDKMQFLYDKLKELDLKIEDIETKLNSNHEQLIDKNYIYTKDTIEENKTKVVQAKTLNDLGIDFQEAIRILKTSNRDIVLDEEDKIPNDKMKDTSGINGIAFTHLTDYLPENGEILRMIDKSAKHIESKEWGEISVSPARETIHLAACSEVANVDFSSWDDRRIGIILPLKGFSKDINITSFNPADTQIKGSVKIPDSGYIICPKDMMEEAKQKNPNINVIGYEGENVRGLVNQMLVNLGYDFYKVGTYDFLDTDHKKRI